MHQSIVVIHEPACIYERHAPRSGVLSEKREQSGICDIGNPFDR